MYHDENQPALDEKLVPLETVFNRLQARVQRKREALEQIEKTRQENYDRTQREFDSRLSLLRDILAEALATQEAQEAVQAQEMPQEQLVQAQRHLQPIRGPAPIGPQPRLMSLLFTACHIEKDRIAGRFAPIRENQYGALRLANTDSRGMVTRIDLRHPDEVPREFRNANADPQQFSEWVWEGTSATLVRLDALAWEVAVFLVVSFFQQTSGLDVDEEFYVFVNDFFEWRGVHPSNRTPELRERVIERIRLFFHLRMYAEDTLYLRDEKTGRKKKTLVSPHGPFLRESLCYDRPEGFLVSLGKWAKEYVEETAMLGVYLRRLAGYNPNTQHWERQIGWYLVFQLQNQASRMDYREVGEELQGVMRQPLRMESILNGACLPWQRLALNDPGKVVRQFSQALETLKHDGIISDYECLDGAADGSDLTQRKGKLDKMLDRRYRVSPGADLLPHLYAKKTARIKSQARSNKRQSPHGRAENDAQNSEKA